MIMMLAVFFFRLLFPLLQLFSSSGLILVVIKVSLMRVWKWFFSHLSTLRYDVSYSTVLYSNIYTALYCSALSYFDDLEVSRLMLGVLGASTTWARPVFCTVHPFPAVLGTTIHFICYENERRLGSVFGWVPVLGFLPAPRPVPLQFS